MRIDSTHMQLPMHIARAYGVKAATAPAPVRPVHNQTPGEMSRLVAGTVAKSVNFDASAAAQSGSSMSFQMYTRAADRIEAATAIQVGRTIDVTG